MATVKQATEPMKTREHHYEIVPHHVPSSPGYQKMVFNAVCSCGFTSPDCVRPVDAQEEGDEHVYQAIIKDRLGS